MPNSPSDTLVPRETDRSTTLMCSPEGWSVQVRMLLNKYYQQMMLNYALKIDTTKQTSFFFKCLLHIFKSLPVIKKQLGHGYNSIGHCQNIKELTHELFKILKDICSFPSLEDRSLFKQVYEVCSVSQLSIRSACEWG